MDFPSNVICDNAATLEFKAFKECFDLELYAYLQSVLIDYIGTKEFCEGEDYNEGDLVFYGGSVWVSKSDKNEAHPCEPEWCKAPKFRGDHADCLNEFWKCYLCPWLSYLIMWQLVGLPAYKMSAAGPGKIKDDSKGFYSLSPQEIKILKNSIKCLVEAKWEVLEYQLSCTECEPLKKKQCAPCEKEKNCNTRRQRIR